MDRAERKASALRRRLRSAERLSDAAIRFGLLSLNTPGSRSSALLSRVTRCDHLRAVRVPFRPAALRDDLRAGASPPRADVADVADLVRRFVFFAMVNSASNRWTTRGKAQSF